MQSMAHERAAERVLDRTGRDGAADKLSDLRGDGVEGLDGLEALANGGSKGRVTESRYPDWGSAAGKPTPGASCRPNDAIVRLTASAICGTDLHFVRGTMSGMKPGTILGHEGVGIVEEVGANVRNLRPGDRVVIASTIGCGFCSYCRAGYYAQCDTTQPKGGTAFFGGPEAAGYYGMQAEYVRVPNANRLQLRQHRRRDDPSHIPPTALSAPKPPTPSEGEPEAPGRVPRAPPLPPGSRPGAPGAPPSPSLQTARPRPAARGQTLNHPEHAIRELTGGIGPDRVIDAVGVDAEHVHGGPGANRTETSEEQFAAEIEQTAPEHTRGGARSRSATAPRRRWRCAGPSGPSPRRGRSGSSASTRRRCRRSRSARR